MGICKISFDRDVCVGCGACVRSCPLSVLRMEEGRPEAYKPHRCIDCLHCVAICPTRAVRYEDVAPETLYRRPPEGELERLIATRRSVRSFRPEAPDRALIQSALDATAYAPSGKNAHANGWTVVMGLEETEELTRWTIEWCRANGEAPELVRCYDRGVNLLTCNAPCVIVGWSPVDALNPCVDTVVAMTTAELLLVKQGLGSCWGGYLRQISDASPELRARLKVPENCLVYCTLMVGRPDRERYLNLPWKPPVEVQWTGAAE